LIIGHRVKENAVLTNFRIASTLAASIGSTKIKRS
jgi:hypothetical protein